MWRKKRVTKRAGHSASVISLTNEAVSYLEWAAWYLGGFPRNTQIVGRMVGDTPRPVTDGICFAGGDVTIGHLLDVVNRTIALLGEAPDGPPPMHARRRPASRRRAPR